MYVKSKGLLCVLPSFVTNTVTLNSVSGWIAIEPGSGYGGNSKNKTDSEKNSNGLAATSPCGVRNIKPKAGP